MTTTTQMQMQTMERCEQFESAPLPLWREAFWGLDWLALRRSPVFYGMGVPRGDGAPVILIPGFLASDNSLHEMFQWLRPA